jgi:hypothetical protein
LGPTHPSTSPAFNCTETFCTAGSAPYRFTNPLASSTAAAFVRWSEVVMAHLDTISDTTPFLKVSSRSLARHNSLGFLRGFVEDS